MWLVLIVSDIDMIIGYKHIKEKLFEHWSGRCVYYAVRKNNNITKWHISLSSSDLKGLLCQYAPIKGN